MTGYQEVLTDPSYTGQLVTMTYPLIGNYGVNAEDCESPVPQVSGFVVREASRVQSNWRSEGGLDDYLREHGITGISEIDTRALTRHIRSEGAMRGAIAPADTDSDRLLSQILDQPKMEGLDLACGDPATARGLETKGAEGDVAALVGQARHPALVTLAILDALGGQHR